MNNKELDNIENEALHDIQSSQEILENLKTNTKLTTDQHLTNKGENINLGELGTFKKANRIDIDDVFDKLPGTIFKIKSCLFRVTYIKEYNRFTAELING